ncbi:hypothetical protein ACRAWF_35975 [Streptomyces sp. L7]
MVVHVRRGRAADRGDGLQRADAGVHARRGGTAEQPYQRCRGVPVPRTGTRGGGVVEQRSDAGDVSTIAYGPDGGVARAANADAEVVLERDLRGRVLSENDGRAHHQVRVRRARPPHPPGDSVRARVRMVLRSRGTPRRTELARGLP